MQTSENPQISLNSIKSNVDLKICKIQRSCFYDGPGVRTTIFFRGCNLKCLWCQNPEMQSFRQIHPI
jgi:pyruvate-formate lyase-activating enzyme